MTGFDPAAATAAYLAQLSPEVRRAAEIHTETGHWLWAAHIATMLAACWLMLRLDLFGRLRRRIEARRERSGFAAVIFAAVFAVAMIALSMAVEAVGAAVSGQVRAVPYGLWLIGAIVVLPLVYAAARARPRRWWLWSGGTFAVLAILVAWVPFASASGPSDLPPVPPGPVREALLALARDARLPIADIYLSPSKAIDGDVTGLPGRPRVAITQGMLSGLSLAQARASVGHLMGHYANQDQLTLALLLGALGLGGAYAVHRLFRPAAKAMGRGDLVLDDPAGLPVAVAIGVVWLALATVGYDNAVRLINVRADQYSLGHAREPDGLAQSLLRSDRADKVDPSPLEEAVFYNHPSLQSRIAHAMTWKATAR
jgi:STE24 endopeptidase